MSLYTAFVLGSLLGFIACLVLIFLLVYLAGLLAGGSNQKSPADIPAVSHLVRIGMSLLFVSAVAGACYVAQSRQMHAFLFLLLSVFLTAKFGGRIASLAASAAAAIVLTLLFLPPVGSLQIERPTDQRAMAIFLLSTLVISMLSPFEEGSDDQGMAS